MMCLQRIEMSQARCGLVLVQEGGRSGSVRTRTLYISPWLTSLIAMSQAYDISNSDAH